MRLGAEAIALRRPASVGRPYKQDSASNDLWFQHIAVVVADMDAAYAHLCAHEGWTPISVDGPQELPPENGSVRAFKFRDPVGHPVELIWFPPGQGRAVWHRPAQALFLGIDHSAIAVSDAARSTRFYEQLGLLVADRSHNVGPAQDRLDGLAGADARIIGLRPPDEGGMGIELLAYDPPGRRLELEADDLAADALTIAAGRVATLQDPDGHRLILM